MDTIVAAPLENRWVRLEPLHPGHTRDLNAAATDPDETFRWVTT